MGKELHLFITGCNTIQICPALLDDVKGVPEAARASVWLLCTSTLWPGDLAVFLWHLYGATAQFDDMQSFRQQTRALLQEYTPHFKRMHITDATREEKCAKLRKDLSEAVHLDRLDRIRANPGEQATVARL